MPRVFRAGRWPISLRGLPAFVLSLALLLPAATWAQTVTLRPARVHDPNVTEPLAIVVRPEGFPLREMHVPQGKYLLIIMNRSGIDDLSVQVDRMQGTDLAGKATATAPPSVLSKSKSRASVNVVLTPGTYRLSVAGMPKWLCRVVVD